jgi:RNA polymerase subunit RPABC4/transcription elongation factor Spt4
MAACSSCGTPVTDLQKFCRGCGATVRAAAVAASAPGERTCGRCGHYVATDARFCRACGTGFEPSQSQPQVAARHLRKRRSSAVWLIPVIATLCIAMIAGACFLWSRGFSDPTPDATIVQNAVAQQLPPYVRLNSLTLGQLQRDDSATPPLMNGQFTAAAVLTASLYKPSRADGDVTFLAEQAAAGTTMELAGSVLLRQNGGQWESRVVLATHPLMAALPKEAFANVQTIVEGSPEQQLYVDARMRQIEAAQAAEAARAAAEAERVRLDAEARRLAAERAAQARRETELAQAAERIRAAREAQVRAEIAERERALAFERERIAEAQRARVAQPAIHTPPPQAALHGSIPRGAETTVRLTRRLRTDALQVEDRFEAITIEDIIVSGRVVVPAGATLRGVVAMVEPANRTNRNAKLDLRFDLLTIGTQSVPIRARATRVLTSSGMRNDAVKAGVGAAAGAVIGAILGGGKGAAIGGAIGGGGTLAAMDGQEIDLTSGSTLRIAFDSAVEFE